MDEAGALGVGDEIGGAEIAQVVPFALRAFGAGQRVRKAQTRQFFGGDVAERGGTCSAPAGPGP